MRAFGTETTQTYAASAGIVALEGGGSIPTLDLGGGARARVPEERSSR
jgi:hypothetical protein